MGTPLPPLPIDPGDLCGFCWGSGKPLGNVTSRVISVTLYDLEEGTEWEESFRDELFTPTDLIQDSSFPCEFRINTPNFLWQLAFGIDFTFLQVSKLFGTAFTAFVLFTSDVCILTAPNDNTSPSFRVAFDGTMSLYLGSAL